MPKNLPKLHFTPEKKCQEMAIIFAQILLFTPVNNFCPIFLLPREERLQ